MVDGTELLEMSTGFSRQRFASSPWVSAMSKTFTNNEYRAEESLQASSVFQP